MVMRLGSGQWPILALIMMASFVTYEQARSEQTFFSEEQPIRNPVPVSSSLLKLLLSTKEVKEGLELAPDSLKRDPATLFQISEIHLGRPDEVDLVVMGIPPMRGADNTWFWVVRLTNKNSKLVLFAGGGSLEVLGRRVNGLKSIRTAWNSPSDINTSIYDFDGRHYKLRSSKWTPLK